MFFNKLKVFRWESNWFVLIVLNISMNLLGPLDLWLLHLKQWWSACGCGVVHDVGWHTGPVWRVWKHEPICLCFTESVFWTMSFSESMTQHMRLSFSCVVSRGPTSQNETRTTYSPPYQTTFLGFWDLIFLRGWRCLLLSFLRLNWFVSGWVVDC